MQDQNIRGMNIFRQGLLWGALLGILNILLIMLSTFTHLSLLNTIMVIIDIVVYLCAGLRAAQGTGRTGTGALVGFFVGLYSAIISAIGTTMSVYINADSFRRSAQSIAEKLHQNVNNLLIASVVLQVIGMLILALVLGTVVGAIGGAIGKSRVRNKQTLTYENS